MEIDKLHDVYIGLGTNLGNKQENIFEALKYLNERVGMVIVHSSFYSTRPVGFDSPNDFLNTTCLVMTHLSPLELLAVTQQIEMDMGRKNKSEHGVYHDRIIDIDILLYDDLILKTEEIELPHPHLHKRSFVLNPLAEIAGQYTHPILHETIAELQLKLNNQ